MKRKNLFLATGILTFLVFIGYMGEPGPHSIFGVELNIWIIRLIWLIISISNFTNYFALKKAEKK